MEKEIIKKKWYDNKVLLIVLFFVFPFLGIFGILKHNTATWKKLLFILHSSFYCFVLVVYLFAAIFLDDYKDGMDYYNNHDYRNAYHSFEKVKPTDKNYKDAFTKLKEIKPIFDSLMLSEEKKRVADSLSESNASSVKHEVPHKTEGDYIKYFQNKWDSVTITYDEKFPKYETYKTSLDDILQEMVTVLGKDTSFKFDSPSKLNKLRLKFIDSKKMKQALSNWLTYGQPEMDFDLKYPCEEYIKDNANDPSSIDFDGFKIKGQSKNGWVVLIRYRGKNVFGGTVLNVNSFIVKFNPTEKSYYVSSVQ